MTTLTWYGHSAIQLQNEKFSLLIDPFFSGNPSAPIPAAQVAKCDFILVTHGHADHLGDAVGLAKKHNATVVATWELAKYLGDKGVKKVHPMSAGGAHEFPFGRARMTLAFHGCGGDDDPEGVVPPPNTPIGFLISFGKKTVYHAGDTALFSDMKLIGERGPIHAACVPIGDNFTMGIEDAAQACEWLDAQQCVPIHYNTFDIIRADAKAFAYKVEKQGRKCLIPEPGTPVEI